MADTPKPPPADLQLQIQLDDDVAQGQYVNMALVNHTETEFVLDFIYVQPQQPKAKVRSRVITNPLTRYVVTAFDWLTNANKWPCRQFRAPEEAERWLRDELRKSRREG